MGLKTSCKPHQKLNPAPSGLLSVRVLDKVWLHFLDQVFLVQGLAVPLRPCMAWRSQFYFSEPQFLSRRKYFYQWRVVITRRTNDSWFQINFPLNAIPWDSYFYSPFPQVRKLNSQREWAGAVACVCLVPSLDICRLGGLSSFHWRLCLLLLWTL